MPGPARAGAVIYAKDVVVLTSFYQALLAAELLYADTEHAVLQSADVQLVIHAIPRHIAATIDIASPPAPREETAIKLFFTVPSLEWSRDLVTRHGGSFTQSQLWEGPGFTACNAVDPEGNVFQVREFDATT